MLKIVVVGRLTDPVYFERDKISAYFDAHTEQGCLIVNDLSSGTPTKIGAFKHWDYWHYVEE